MAGKWRIDMQLRPAHLEHINLVPDPENTEQFHTQPRPDKRAMIEAILRRF